MLKKSLIAGLALFCATGSKADTKQPSQFLMVTITEIGRPYTVINGGCAYGKQSGGDIFSAEFDSAFVDAAIKLRAIATSNGGDAVVGMSAQPISEAAADRNGIMVCGTIVKLK